MDDVITLIRETVTGYDKNGNEIVETEERDLLCRAYGVNRSEFYSAAAVNFRPEITIRLSDIADYQGEDLARFHDVLYSIIRTYRDAGSLMGSTGARYRNDMDPNGVELILQRKIGDVEA